MNPSRTPSRLTLVSAIAVIAAVTAMALLWNPAVVPAGWEKPAGVVHEYLQEARSLTARGFVLSSGWRWPKAPPIATVGPDGKPINYGAGLGRGLADEYWFYSWASRAVSPALSAAVQRAALLRLVDIRQTYYYKKTLAPSARSALDRELSLALGGDISRLEQDVRVNQPPH